MTSPHHLFYFLFFAMYLRYLLNTLLLFLLYTSFLNLPIFCMQPSFCIFPFPFTDVYWRLVLAIMLYYLLIILIYCLFSFVSLFINFLVCFSCFVIALLLLIYSFKSRFNLLLINYLFIFKVVINFNCTYYYVFYYTVFIIRI